MTSESTRAPGALTVYRRQAMASDFEVVLNESREDFGADAALDALDEVDRVEEILSIFRPTSAISRVNLLASEMNVRVDAELWDWIQTSVRLGAETDGAFDVASAPLWRAWGFADRDGEFPAPDVLERALAASGVRHLQLDPAERSIAFDAPGVELNFGAIGKGIALDAAAKKLDDKGVFDFLIQGGKSGAIARGGRRFDFQPEPTPTDDEEKEENPDIDEESGLPVRNARGDAREAIDALLPDALKPDRTEQFDEPREEGWTIGAAHPLAPEKRVGVFWLRDRALATSGSTYQFFRSGGKRYSHIIDPRDGRPTVGVLSTTVLAPTAAEADALSTAFFVLGPDRAQEFCARRPEIGALLVLEREKSPGFELAEFNLNGAFRAN